MTRHGRGYTDGEEEDAPWRDRDYERAPRQPGTSAEYLDDPARGSHRPARGALGTSSQDTGPGEVTGPPWEMPGWDDSQPNRRAPRQGGLTGGHPSGPLPRVSSSGPLPRMSPDSWPGATSGPLPVTSSAPLPPGARGDHSGRGYGSDGSRGSGYPADPYLDADGSGYPGGGREAYPGPLDDAPYLRTGLPDTRYGGGHDAGPDYGPDPSYPRSGFGDHPPGHGGYERDDYTSEPGYPDEGFGAGDYADEPGYPGQGYPSGSGYEPQEGYPPGEHYPAGEDYGHDPRHTGYPDDETGYLSDHETGYPSGEEAGYSGDDEYPASHGEHPRDHEDDRGYGDARDWYGDVDDDQAWADDDEYDDGFLPGLARDADTRRAGPPGPNRAPRAAAGSTRSRGGGGGKARPRKSPMRRAAPWIALSVVVVALLVLGGVGYYFYRTYLHPPDYSGPGTGEVTVHITSGETATQVGQQLFTLGVVASTRAFSNAAKASSQGSALQPGYYQLHKHMAAKLAFAMLLKPSSRVQLNLLIPPGLRLYEIIALLGKDTGNLKGYQQASKNVSALGLPSYAKGNLEGYLSPNTYTVQPGTSPTQVLRELVQGFNHEAASVNLPKVAAQDHVSPGDIITIASIIQAEGKRPSDLPKIAEVIYNRLNLGMKLQLDTTVLYALHSRAPDVTIAQTHTKSPYNTYLHVGLPPGPIDSPGPAAIQAALHPARGNPSWLYFLTVNPKTGLTKFTGSYTQFQIYVQELDNYLNTHH